VLNFDFENHNVNTFDRPPPPPPNHLPRFPLILPICDAFFVRLSATGETGAGLGWENFTAILPRRAICFCLRLDKFLPIGNKDPADVSSVFDPPLEAKVCKNNKN